MPYDDALYLQLHSELTNIVFRLRDNDCTRDDVLSIVEQALDDCDEED